MKDLRVLSRSPAADHSTCLSRTLEGSSEGWRASLLFSLGGGGFSRHVSTAKTPSSFRKKRPGFFLRKVLVRRVAKRGTSLPVLILSVVAASSSRHPAFSPCSGRRLLALSESDGSLEGLPRNDSPQSGTFLGPKAYCLLMYSSAAKCRGLPDCEALGVLYSQF